jgi:plastocyanin
MGAHPAHIHAGTCDELGEVVFPLTDVGETGMTEGMMASTPEAGGAETELGEPTGAETAFAVATSSTLVDAPLAEIVEGGHAINVHQSAENIDNYIACGDLGGRIATGPGTEQGGTLVVGLGQLNASGASGIAVLEGQGDRTEVVLYLARGLAGGTTGTTEGTPAAAAPAAEEVVVDIENFAFGYDPDRVAIPVGGTVTWTNGDAAPHTATGRDREVLQSGRLDKGDRYRRTFDEPGTYEYFCEIHPNMRGTVVVG